ncbi:MAG: hypothetical protein ABJ215_02860 [Alphaproteobacteria bacterium]
MSSQDTTPDPSPDLEMDPETDPEEQDFSPSENLADPELRKLCAAALAEWKDQIPEEERAWTNVDEIVLEAQVLLMCEAIADRQLQNRRLEKAVAEVGQARRDEVVILVRKRLFEKDEYLTRLRRVEPFFRQLIKGEMNRSVTRPAKINKTAKS